MSVAAPTVCFEVIRYTGHLERVVVAATQLGSLGSAWPTSPLHRSTQAWLGAAFWGAVLLTKTVLRVANCVSVGFKLCVTSVVDWIGSGNDITMKKAACAPSFAQPDWNPNKGSYASMLTV